MELFLLAEHLIVDFVLRLQGGQFLICLVQLEIGLRSRLDETALITYLVPLVPHFFDAVLQCLY